MSLLAVLVYVLAMGLPVAILYFCRSCAWYWHALAILAGLGLGFVPTPQQFKTPAYDVAFGAVLLFLMVWGIGGLVLFRPHHEKHA